jgi:hypothetical protein
MAWCRVSLNLDKPLRGDLLLLLNQEIHAHPEMLTAGDYPSNIIKWIEDHLFIWDRGDLLGVYFPQLAVVELYWLSIILSARRNKWAVSNLAMVVLVHEYAHACTHLGDDADAQCWDVDVFCKTDDGLIEGLAQYWTHYLLCGQQSNLSEGFFDVFLKLMKLQPPPYRAHMAWLDKIPIKRYLDYGVEHHSSLEINKVFEWPICENIRAAMINLRRSKDTLSVDAFTNKIDVLKTYLEGAVTLF